MAYIRRHTLGAGSYDSEAKRPKYRAARVDRELAQMHPSGVPPPPRLALQQRFGEGQGGAAAEAE